MMNPHLRDYSPADRAAVFAANAAHYKTVEHFDESFTDALNAALEKITADIARGAGYGCVLAPNDAHKGSVFLTQEGEAEAGRIRLFYIDDDMRGHGHGRAMLARLIEKARDFGWSAIYVSTFTCHESACRLYRAYGFEEIGQHAVTAFGRDLTQVDFCLRLRKLE